MTRCDNCGKSFLFMKLYPINSNETELQGLMMCERCKFTIRSRKKN